MKMKKNDFKKLIKGQGLLVAAICGILVAGPVRAAGDGCEDEKNDRITPELALCSVHAYNIGSSSNPMGADKQLMKEIIALKTTVITQQMNKQYEYMEAMIRRFKTQLEKAVLTTKLQAAGATPTSGSGTTAGGGSYGGASGNMMGGVANNGLATAEDCMNTYASTADVMQCLLRNVSKIQTAVAAGDLGTARRQLATDRATLNSFNRMSITAASGQQGAAPNVPCQNALAADQTCARAVRSGSRREDLTTCLGQMRACIIANSEALQNANRQQTRI